MSQSTYNLGMKDAATLIDSVLEEESARTGLRLQINRRGDIEVQTDIPGLPVFSFPVYSIPSIYSRLIWEVIKCEANCKEQFDPRRLTLGTLDVVVRYNNSTHYAVELFEAAPSWIGARRHATTCTLETREVSRSSLLEFRDWLHFIATAELSYSSSPVTATEMWHDYVGVRGDEKFIVQVIPEGFKLVKENGKPTTAAKLYDIELRELDASAKRLPHRILCSRIYKRGGGPDGRVPGSDLAEREDIS